jgi:DNA-binding NarL/FixJ family response regulator
VQRERLTTVVAVDGVVDEIVAARTAGRTAVVLVPGRLEAFVAQELVERDPGRWLVHSGELPPDRGPIADEDRERWVLHLVPAGAAFPIPSPVPPRTVLVVRGGPAPSPSSETMIVQVRRCVPADVVRLADEVSDPDELVRITAGDPALVLSLLTTGSADDLVVRAVASLDEDAERLLTGLAFGLVEVESIGAVDPSVGDQAWGRLEAEGLAVEGTVVPIVAEVVRRTSNRVGRERVATVAVVSARRGVVADFLVAAGAVGPAVARVLAEEGAARAWWSPMSADHLLEAAELAGARVGDLALPRSIVRLVSGDPVGALQFLDGASGAEVELVRAAAMLAIGDRRASCVALERAGANGWTAVVAGGSAAMVPPDVDPAVDPAAGLVDLVERWLAGDETGLDATVVTARVALRRCRSVSAPTPVVPEVVAGSVVASLAGAPTALDLVSEMVAERDPTSPVDVASHRTIVLASACWRACSGELSTSRSELADVSLVELDPYQHLVRAAVECAIAVRDPEAAGLEAAVTAGRRAIRSWPPGPLELGLLTEIARAFARRGLPTDEVFDLVSPLGSAERRRGVAVEAALGRLRAALAGGDLVPIRSEAVAVRALLESVGSRSPRERAWSVAAAHLDDGVVDQVAEAVAAAQGLAEVGDVHDAGRLCAVLALLVSDPVHAKRLLRESRAWRVERVRSAGSTSAAVSSLSAQEERVGRMLLDGHTHKEIGAALFVSPKTVEHHAAHIRTKLGVSSRAEMMAALRTHLGG